MVRIPVLGSGAQPASPPANEATSSSGRSTTRDSPSAVAVPGHRTTDGISKADITFIIMYIKPVSDQAIRWNILFDG
jgi:hypothetical protein